MRVLLNGLGIVFMLGWFVGLLIFSDTILIHILLVLSIFSFSLGLLITEHKSVENHHRIKS